MREEEMCPECKILLVQHPTIKTLWECPECSETFEDFRTEEKGSFDLIKTIKFKQKIFSEPITGYLYNNTMKRKVENNADWLDGLYFGTEQAIRSIENWFKSKK